MRIIEKYLAVVKNVVQGKHGFYAVTEPKNQSIGGTITFSLKSENWLEKILPDRGSYVVLSELRRKRGGWRAEQARFLRPNEQEEFQLTRKEE